ncbi:Cytochrome c oxidase subunit 6 [Maublancomyces gigas]|uniref:Cytochrome c oxidase subunit 6 n=1 Tax=Discina gigas TaxID=1032678 RepID=A0ABR3GVW0_9PEZI
MASLFRLVSSAAKPILRTSSQFPRVIAPAVLSRTIPTTIRFYSDSHEESFEEFTARYEKEFDNVNDVFELQVRILPRFPNRHLGRKIIRSLILIKLIAQPQQRFCLRSRTLPLSDRRCPQGC